MAPMRAPIYQLDAFTSHRFAGNPAAVMLLEAFLPDAMLQSIAAENNLAETAFLVRAGDDYQLRWFTPVLEVPLCGHATLASAAVVMERLEPSRQRVIFHTASGPLTVDRRGAGYVMDFPVRHCEPVAAPAGLGEALGARAIDVVADKFAYLVLLDNANSVRELAPDLAAITRLDRVGVIVTAADDGHYDFVSRYFAPARGMPEDPVTGSAHCALTPYWAKRLNRTSFRAFQASRRGGEILCRLKQGRVELEGPCVFYLEGHAEI
jgi:PhzF family phenazine biosynthesis protein